MPVVRVAMARREGTAILAPKVALVAEGDAVFLVREGLAHRVGVRTGALVGDWIEAMGEITEGDSVIVGGMEGLRDGVQVKVAPWVQWAPQGIRWTTKKRNTRTGEEEVTGSGEATW